MDFGSPQDFNADVPAMGLRDWFAGQAMQGFLANQKITPYQLGELAEVAAGFYLLADAMLKARDKP